MSLIELIMYLIHESITSPDMLYSIRDITVYTEYIFKNGSMYFPISWQFYRWFQMCAKIKKHVA